MFTEDDGDICKVIISIVRGPICLVSPENQGLIVSPLATLAFKLCVVGDTGLKTGWVRCRHGAGGGAGGGAGWGYHGTSVLLLSPGNRVCVCN